MTRPRSFSASTAVLALSSLLPLLCPWLAVAAQQQKCGADGSSRCAARQEVAPSGDPYSILGVSADADAPTVIRAYRKLARKWHPDKRPGQEAESVFATIARAYDVLTDPEKREIYDRLGEKVQACRQCLDWG